MSDEDSLLSEGDEARLADLLERWEVLGVTDDPDAFERFLAQHCPDEPNTSRQLRELIQAAAWGRQLELDQAGGNDDMSTWDWAPRPSLIESGAQIGHYKLLQRLGHGGMGEVWMAEQQAPVRRKVAIKFLSDSRGSKTALARFEQERQSLALMDHPNIAKVFDAGATADGRPFFVMELVKGIPLTEFCDREKLTPQERLELFLPICLAVQHAHQKGIIHRDLKPSNLLVALYDGKAIPKVIDFGVAKSTQQKLTELTLFTEVGQTVGTWAYISPEQAELNNLDVDTRADVYALGVTLYELLTGTLPFTLEQLRNEAIRLIREVDPPTPSARLSGSKDLPLIAERRKQEPRRLAKLVQGELDWIVMKCLEKERHRRYETVDALAQDVQRYLQDEPVMAGPPGAVYRLRKLARKHRRSLLMGTVLALLMPLGIVWTSWGWRTAELASQRALAAKREANAETQKAQAAEKKAATEKEGAEKQRELAKEQKKISDLRLYAAQISRAQQEWNWGKPSRAWQHLNGCHPYGAPERVLS